jgi:serine/threonine protein kinase
MLLTYWLPPFYLNTPYSKFSLL